MIRRSKVHQRQLHRIQHVLETHYAGAIARHQEVDPPTAAASARLMTAPAPEDYAVTGKGDLSSLMLGDHGVLIYFPLASRTIEVSGLDPLEGQDLVETTIRVEHFFRVDDGWSPEHVQHLQRHSRPLLRDEIAYLRAQDYAGAQLECLLAHAADGLTINEIWADAESPQDPTKTLGLGYLGYAATQYTARVACIVPVGRYDTP